MLDRRRGPSGAVTLWCLLQQSFFKEEEVVAEVLDFMGFSDGFFYLDFRRMTSFYRLLAAIRRVYEH